MRPASLTALALLLLTLAAAAPAADEKPLVPGLKAGDPLPAPFHPFEVTGKHLEATRRRLADVKESDTKEQQEEKVRRALATAPGVYHSLVSEHGLDPVVMILVREDDPAEVKELLTKLNDLVGANELLRLGAFVVFLRDDLKDLARDDAKREEARLKLQKSYLADLKNIAAAVDTLADVKDTYKLDEDAAVTVVMYNRLKVLGAWAYRANELKDGEAKLLEEVQAQLEAIRARAATGG